MKMVSEVIYLRCVRLMNLSVTKMLGLKSGSGKHLTLVCGEEWCELTISTGNIRENKHTPIKYESAHDITTDIIMP